MAVWDAATLTMPRTLSVPDGSGLISDADLTRDGSVLMLSTPNGVQLWDVDQEVQLPSSPLVAGDGDGDGKVSYAAMSPDGASVGATVYEADGTTTIRIWDVAGGTAVTHAVGGSDTFVDVSFSDDGRYFATLDVFGELASYRASDGARAGLLLTPDDVTTTLTGRPARRDHPGPGPLVRCRQRERERALLERGNRAGDRAVRPRAGWEPERDHRERERGPSHPTWPAR